LLLFPKEFSPLHLETNPRRIFFKNVELKSKISIKVREKEKKNACRQTWPRFERVQLAGNVAILTLASVDSLTFDAHLWAALFAFNLVGYFTVRLLILFLFVVILMLL